MVVNSACSHLGQQCTTRHATKVVYNSRMPFGCRVQGPQLQGSKYLLLAQSALQSQMNRLGMYDWSRQDTG